VTDMGLMTNMESLTVILLTPKRVRPVNSRMRLAAIVLYVRELRMNVTMQRTELFMRNYGV
jgi:hypothetical protein